MDSNIYSIKTKKEDIEKDWKALMLQSSQYTPFSRDDYLDALGFDSLKILVYRKNEPFCGICLPIERSTGEYTAIVPYAPYQGLFYKSTQDCYKDYHNNLEATDLLLNFLYENFNIDKLGFSCCYTVKDIRAVQWHHYHEQEKGTYNIDVNYTAITDLTEQDAIENISKGRKLDYRYSQERYGITIEKSDSIDEFLNLYEKTFSVQGIKLKNEDIYTVRSIIRTCTNAGIGELWYAVDSDGRLIDAVYILVEGERSYYLFGANDPETKKKGGGTLLLIEKLKELKGRGIKTFDYIGVNSPYRGDFKLSFGAKIKPYYVCSVDYKKV